MPHVISITKNATGSEIVANLELAAPTRVLLLHGGASLMSAHGLLAVRTLLEEGVAQAIGRKRVAVLDGGTQTGVAQMMGEGRARAKATFPLIGICPEAEVTWPGGPTASGRHLLDPHHTHFVLTSGERWGDETPYLFALAEALAADAPSLALLINGGAIAKREILANVACGREIVVTRGSGRLADQIADICSGDLAPPDNDFVAIAHKGKITIIELAEGSQRLSELLRQKLHLDS